MREEVWAASGKAALSSTSSFSFPLEPPHSPPHPPLLILIFTLPLLVPYALLLFFFCPSSSSSSFSVKHPQPTPWIPVFYLVFPSNFISSSGL